MKKDMGGAANVLALACMIMGAGLDLICAFWCLPSKTPFRQRLPAGRYLQKPRKGLSVQIDNTDAEGRLILADALAYADEETPDLMIDMATLTGAARVALGPRCSALLYR